MLLNLDGTTTLAEGYSTLAMVQTAAGGSDTLRQISDVEETGAIDADVVADAINDADSVIDSYIGQRVSTPLTVVPRSIQSVSAGWAVRVLRRNRNKGMSSPDDLAADKRDEDWLKLVSEGKASLGIDPPPVKATMVVDKAALRDSTLTVSRERMKDFI
jgi:phage gp36-like protein